MFLLLNKVLAGLDGKDEWLRMKILKPIPAPNLNISFHQFLKKDSSIFLPGFTALVDYS